MIEVSPDINFIEKLQQASGSQLTTCMQCGACTASCSLSAEQEVFPRKQMIMAAWGMKDRLMADPHIWTCHQCGDCSVSCPRGVKPGEILAALRQEQINHYSRPGFLARSLQKPAFLPLALLFPAAVIILILSLAGTFSIPEGPVDYSKFFPHAWLNGSFSALFALSTLGAVAGLKEFWKNIKSATRTGVPGGMAGQQSTATGTEDMQTGHRSTTGQTGSAFARFIKVIWQIARHRDFRQCDEHRSRSISHFMVFWGFILLLFVTFFAILSTIFFDYPLDFLNPIKIAGNLGALLLLTGSSLMILNRILKRTTLRSRYPDWFFLVSFWLLTLSGVLVEGARFNNWDSAYHLYFFHLVMVWIIILYYPYTKFAHFLYRTLALIHIRSIRKPATNKT
jgi:quinone-modifying oxidoreductase subunit QmoC